MGVDKNPRWAAPPRQGCMGLCTFDIRSVQSACYAFYYENLPALSHGRFIVKVDESAAFDSPPHSLTLFMKAVSQILGHRILE